LPRVGWTGHRFELLLGAALQFLPGAPTVLQWVPSARFARRFGAFGLSAGLFDGVGQAPLHLTAEAGDFYVGYMAPLGARAGVRFRLSDGGAVLKLEALG